MTDPIKTLPAKVASLRAGATALLPIYPETFEDVARLARMACMAGMVKPQRIGYGDAAEIENSNAVEARATMIILQGMELGLPPMQSVQLLAMINGRITAHSEAVPGILLSKGFKIKQEFVGVEFEDSFKAVCTLTRPDGESVVSSFSVKDAKDASLWDESPTKSSHGKTKPNDSAWHRYPKRMLWARALGFAAKDKGADAMRGLMVREEMDDMMRAQQAIDITPSAPHATRTASIADIPDIPDEPLPQAAAVPAEPDILDVEGMMAKLSEELTGEKDEAIRQEIWEAHSDLIERMQGVDQRRAQAIFEGRER